MKIAACLLFFACVGQAVGQFKDASPTGEAPGMWQCATIGVGKKADGSPVTTALKGLAIRVGEHGEAAVCYDLDLCRMAGAWTGKFITPVNLMSRGEYPVAMGEVAFTTGEVPGFQANAEPALPDGSAALPNDAAVLPNSGSVLPNGTPELPNGTPELPNGGAALPNTAAVLPNTAAVLPDRGAVSPNREAVSPDKGSLSPDKRPVFGADSSLKSPAGTEKTADWTDPRPEPYGPLPAGGPKFKGFYVNGEQVILKWDVAGTEVLEAPRYQQETGFFYRTFTVAPTEQSQMLTIAAFDSLSSTAFVPRQTGDHSKAGPPGKTRSFQVFQTGSGEQKMAAEVFGEPEGTVWQKQYEQLCLVLPPHPTAITFMVVVFTSSDFSGIKTRGPLRWLQNYAETGTLAPDLHSLIKGGPAHWPEPVVADVAAANQYAGMIDMPPTRGVAYVVENVPLPDPNPYGAPMFVGGFDFFPDGRVAICTFHGDVWIGSGVSLPGRVGILPAGSGILPERSPKDHEDQTRPGSASGQDAPTGGQDAHPTREEKANAERRTPNAEPRSGEADAGALQSAISNQPSTIRWRRFATGLYHALGLKVVNGEIYVTGRDGITRLRDLNGDGEADFYEAFNHDVMVTKSFHEFVFDLQTDPEGNFYFAKAGPVKNGGRGFDTICRDHGTLMRVSPDGRELTTVATGFRAPNGLGAGPRGELTTGDNEGTWTPACKINWVKPGGFYGVVPLAHREAPPTEYDGPLCWLPKRADNSGGAQVWAPPGERWGPWGGQMLHLSYGTCSLFGVMEEEATDFAKPDCCDRVMQGGVVRFPLQFASGVMRARFNPVDGQLYVAGLRGWQTTGLKNGCLQRVRYTGAPAGMPVALHVRNDGIELTFAEPLDTQAAADVENYAVEAWNYVWSAAYGSPEVSTRAPAATPGEAGKDGEAEFSKAQMGVSAHDTVAVKSVSISTDERTIFLAIPELKPVMQMSIKYNIKAADGAPVKGEVLNTIHGFAD